MERGGETLQCAQFMSVQIAKSRHFIRRKYPEAHPDHNNKYIKRQVLEMSLVRVHKRPTGGVSSDTGACRRDPIISSVEGLRGSTLLLASIDIYLAGTQERYLA